MKELLLCFLILVIGIQIVAAVDVTGGKIGNPCTLGPGYWCQTRWFAVKCNKVEYCRKYVWLH
ncbi:prosaposin [Orussus abietinus]|uniref:prosaposin n=1 Tax=Orussus abietinus TaxID=222816 RepID=UPI0006263733|nr:prosaposin [Orussus abietinus]